MKAVTPKEVSRVYALCVTQCSVMASYITHAWSLAPVQPSHLSYLPYVYQSGMWALLADKMRGGQERAFRRTPMRMRSVIQTPLNCARHTECAERIVCSGLECERLITASISSSWQRAPSSGVIRDDALPWMHASATVESFDLGIDDQAWII